MGDIMGKGRVLRGGAERGSDKTEISHCTENSPVDKKTKACPAGSVLSHWEKDKGGQGRGQAALGGGEGVLLLCLLVYSPGAVESQLEELRVTQHHSFNRPRPSKGEGSERNESRAHTGTCK